MIKEGIKLGRYKIRSKLGEGGMGEVYLAQDTKLDRKVALKILPEELAANHDRMRRFVQEAKAASALNHPNIITIYEIDETESGHFIATEFIDGETLRQRLQNSPPNLSQSLDIATQLAGALAAAHANGIVHRDVKPENVMLRRDGIVKMLDFGLAKLAQPPATDDQNIDSQVTTRVHLKTDPGVVMGTAIYMSPEQARGFPVDARSDVFSLGVVLYEMFAGRLPFSGANRNEIIASVLGDQESQPLTRYSSEAPSELGRIIGKALRKNREERYQTIQDMLLDLKSLQQELEFERKLKTSAVDGKTTSPPREDAVADPLTAEAGVIASRRAGQTSGATQISRGLGRNNVIAAIVTVILLTALGTGYWFFSGHNSTGVASIDSIAVLPLANASNDPNAEYLSDGISEALINSLTDLQRLRVVARTTAFRYKGREIDPQTVGRELNVRAVLIGRVRQIGDSLDVQVDLVDTTTGAQLWGQEYERKASDLLAVKQSIAREVIAKLKLRLSSDEQQKLARRDTKDAEAYQFYLRGRYFLGKRTTEALQKAIGEFQQSIDRDPNYALGFVGLADAYSLLEQNAGMPASETQPKARAAADRALQIDDSLSEAHTSSAKIYEDSWRWAEAEEEYKRAINLNPNYPIAHQWYALYLRTRQRFDEALSEIKRAQELDPLSSLINANAAFAHLLKNDPTSTIEQDQKVVELDPDFWIAHNDMGFAYLKLHRYEEAIAEFQKGAEASGRSSLGLGNLGHGYGVVGKRAEAQAIAKELEARYARHEAIGFNLASVYAGLSDKDQAFAWLEKDFQQRSGQLQYITWWPNFDSLRGDRRYTDLVHRMGL